MQYSKPSEYTSLFLQLIHTYWLQLPLQGILQLRRLKAAQKLAQKLAGCSLKQQDNSMPHNKKNLAHRHSQVSRFSFDNSIKLHFRLLFSSVKRSLECKKVKPRLSLPKDASQKVSIKNIKTPQSQEAELKAALLIALQIPRLKEPGSGTQYGSKDAKTPTSKRELWTADTMVGFLMAIQESLVY